MQREWRHVLICHSLGELLALVVPGDVGSETMGTCVIAGFSLCCNWNVMMRFLHFVLKEKAARGSISVEQRPGAEIQFVRFLRSGA